ncbi:uncharacterized protein MELLADRAFT_79675 [Melampsora larici-populina 98AG31]|uniref:Nucleolar 27S pre-rRNA processing Urb2/Npa2 C-terminal domain-containing protein n=1 Tax=Melampsora larici-populina (strain 98AG31 / pathotype 3-4-7) TaxID=747676 RepID=F4S9Y3_MELLP|nr:uncharacterized protein MELLADRAFT_79675 [Melampsora larici-populina 98AG31]EGF98549.1 hypothetical protein MELLADRAFT_79675 [Melampsora larici-populina 98AG31]
MESPNHQLQEFNQILKTISASKTPIQSIHQAYSFASSSISPQHQLQYLLSSILDSNQSNSSKSNSNFNSILIHETGFWSLFHQILSNLSSDQIIQSTSKSSIQAFIQISFKSLPVLLNQSDQAKYVCNSSSILINSISNRISFESITDLIQSILEVFINLENPISLEFEEIILILTNELLFSLPQTSNLRKGITLASDHHFVHLFLSSLSKIGITSSIGSSLLRFLTDCIFNIDQLKRSLSFHTPSRGLEKDLDWLVSLRLVVVNQPQLAIPAIQLLPSLILALIKERSVIQAHVFAPIAATSARPTSNGIDQTTNLESAQDFILHFVLFSHQLIQTLVLPSDDSKLIEHAISSIKTITSDLLAANIYSLSSRFHFEVIDQITIACIDRLIESPKIATKSFQTLSDILTIDYRIIEARLPQILQSLFSKTFDDSSLLVAIDTFLNALIEWFSKAKQIPQLLNFIHDALDQNLSKSSLSILMSTPLNSSVTIRKLQHELLLSVSSAQLNQAHATASDRLLNAYRTIFPPRGIDDERSSKKSKRSTEPTEPTESTMAVENSQNDKTPPSEVDVARCVTCSHFYIVLATAAARSLLHTQDPPLAVALDDTLRELTGMISDLCPESKKNKRARSSDGLLSTPGLQTVVATIFEILNAVSELRHSTTNFTPKDLSRWLKFSSKAMNETCELNPALVVQIAQAALLQISASVTSDETPGDLASLAYDVILRLLDFKTHEDMDTVWNGAFHSLTSSQIPCAIWYNFSTIHLSNFSDLATTEQLQSLSKIILRCPPFQLTQAVEEKNQAAIPKRGSITFRQVNAALVSSPSLHELDRVCTSVLQSGLDLLRHISSSYDISTPPSRDTSEKILLESIGLFAILAKLPLDCLSKSNRIEYLQKSLDWSLKILSMQAGSSKKKSTKEDKIQALVTNTNIYSIRYIASLICATETTVDESLMNKVVSLATLLLSKKINWESNDQNDVVFELSEIYIQQAISFIFRSMSSLKLKSPKAWDEMSSVLFSCIAKASSHADHDVSNVKSNGLVIKAIDSIINSISSSAPKRGVSDHQVHESWIEFVKALVQCTGEVVGSVSMMTSTLNPFQLEICSSHFRLVRIVGSIGLQDKVRTYKMPIRKVISLSETSSATECQALLPSINSPNQSLILKVVEEMVNLQRSQVTPNGQDTLIKAFQTLTLLYISCLVHTRGDGIQQVNELKHQYSLACRMVSVEEYSETLSALLEHYDRVLSSLNITSRSVGMDDSVKQLKATLEIASILILNAPEALILELVLQSLALPKSNEEPHQTSDLTPNQTSNKFTREIYQSLITIVSQLCRHRREHILPVFHLLMSILLGLLRPICQPVYLVDQQNEGRSKAFLPTQKMIKEAKNEMPSWSWIESVHQSDWNRLGCNSEEGLLYNRLLIGLGIKTSSMKKKCKSDDHKQQEVMERSLRPQIVSLLPALSKHSTFYLVEFLKLSTGFMGIRISSEIENILKNGIYVVLNSMGKHERASIGKRLCEDWSLGTRDEEIGCLGVGVVGGIDLEVGKEVWRKILIGWESSRYKGID